MDMLRVVWAASLALTIGSTSVAAAAVIVPADPYSVFDQARHVWAAQQYPDFLSYTVVVDVSERGVEKSRHYHVTFDARNGSIDVNPVSDEEQAAPPTPSGFTLHLQPKRQFVTLVDKKVGNPGEAVDYLGVPKLSPTYAFGMTSGGETAVAPAGPDSAALVAQIRQQFNDPAPPDKDSSAAGGALKTIAAVSTRTRAYTIRNTGLETVDGHDCWHLVLTPTRTPERLRLRELWIDAKTSQTWRLLSAGNFTGSAAPWVVSFEEIGGAMYIASESALKPVGVGEHRYEKATVAFETIAPAPRPVRSSNFFATKEAIMTEPGDGN